MAKDPAASQQEQHTEQFLTASSRTLNAKIENLETRMSRVEETIGLTDTSEGEPEQPMSFRAYRKLFTRQQRRAAKRAVKQSLRAPWREKLAQKFGRAR